MVRKWLLLIMPAVSGGKIGCSYCSEAGSLFCVFLQFRTGVLWMIIVCARIFRGPFFATCDYSVEFRELKLTILFPFFSCRNSNHWFCQEPVSFQRIFPLYQRKLRGKKWILGSGKEVFLESNIPQKWNLMRRDQKNERKNRERN